MGRDEDFMRRAVALASVPPFTSPNPRVGAVVVRDGRVIGEGYHEGAGTHHAETRALTGIDARGATLYVNLEPCVHQGRMPPCVPAIVDAGVSRVVVAVEDPDERVAGKGIAELRWAGVEVAVGVSADDARIVNAPYLKHRSTGRPWTTLKLALSLDGRMAAPDGSARWITGDAARRRVHARRVEADAILIGAGTVLADDPTLTAREVGATRQPLRVIVDSTGRVPPDARVFTDDSGVVIVTTDESPHDVHTAWKEAGAEIVVLPRGAGGVDLGELLRHLGERDVVEVYCEGGARLATSLLRDDLVDGLELHYGPVVIGAGGPDIGSLDTASLADVRRFRTVSVDELDGDVVVTVVRR